MFMQPPLFSVVLCVVGYGRIRPVKMEGRFNALFANCRVLACATFCALVGSPSFVIHESLPRALWDLQLFG